MTRCKASFLSRLCFGICFALLPCTIEAILKDACPKEARIILFPKERRDKPMPVSMRNLTVELEPFPRDLTWFANGSTYGCICDVFTCLRLCCLRGSVLRNNTCTPTDGDFVDQWPDIYFTNLTRKPSDDFFPIVEYPCGERQSYSLDLSAPAGSEEEFYLLDDGLSIRVYNSVTNEYCLDRESNAYGPALCFSSDSDSYEVQDLVPVVGILFSIPFLLVTFVVYVLLPELHTIHGLTLRCYVASLCVGWIFLIIERFATVDRFIWLCQLIALGIYFPFMASFAWLNVMCIDIWRTFGSRKAILVVNSKDNRTEFVFYSIYAWGIPSIFSVVCIIMEFVPGLSENVIFPDIASSNRCWFESWEAEVAFYYGPITVIMICNTFMFVTTAVKMMWHQRTVAPQLNNDQSRLHQNAKKWLTLYCKLFMVMGINWITEVVAWWWRDKNLEYLWYIMDIVNALQGFTIFLILVCKRKIIRSLKKRFKKIRRPRRDNELHLHSSSMNTSRKTQNDTSNCQTTKFHDTSTTEPIRSSDSHECLSLENIVEPRYYQ